MGGRYIRQEPYVDDHGIYVPDKEYVPEGCVGIYHCVMTKEMFIEAYNKWINNNCNGFIGQDDADCWSED
jgi:hypothetical protein